jgi:hypothetical protein
MSQAVADRVRDYPLVIAIGNVGLDFAPWAHALVAQDRAWWKLHGNALDFAGRKFSTNKIQGVEQIKSDFLISSQSNSGALALLVARNVFGATDIELHGFDMRGTHYFGKHPEPLRNTTLERFRTFKDQYALIGKHLSKRGVKIVNRTPGSGLRCFPISVGAL